jgi:hypothetical protein
MEGEHGEGGVERRVAHGQGGARGLDDRRGVGRPLADHGARRLDGDDAAIARLVGTGAGADVEDRARRAERGVDVRGDARIGPAQAMVVDSR